MDISTSFTQLIQLGAAGAVIIVVGFFLRFIGQERALDRAIWGTYLADTVRSLEKMSLQMDILIQSNTAAAGAQKLRDELTAVTLRQKDNLGAGERPAVDREYGRTLER